MEVRPLRVVFTAIVGLAVPALLYAQSGVLAGTVRGTIDGRPVSGADIRIVGAGIAPRTAATDSAGAFDFALPPATYTLIVRAPGYEELRRADVRVTAGATVTLDLGLVSEAITLNPLVVSVSRRAEKALDAPAEIGIRRDRAVAERIAPTPVEHIKDLPGIDAAQSGLQQSYVVARGFNNVFTGGQSLVQGPANAQGNVVGGDVGLRDVAAYDYRPTPDSPAVDAGVVAGTTAGRSALPTLQYAEPLSLAKRPRSGPIDAGAYEAGSP